MMADKNNDEVEAKIDEIAQGLKELLAQRDAENAESQKPAKKSTAKKSTAKSTTAKPKSTAKPAAKKAPAKSTAKPAAKKPAAKKTAAPKDEAVKEEPTVSEPVDDEIAKAIAEAEAYAAAESAKKEEPTPEPEKAPEPKAEEIKPEEPTPEPKAEEAKPAEEVKPEPQAEAAAAQEPQASKEPAPKKTGNFAAKTDAALKSEKAKLPIFITINSLFFISAILLMFASFAFGVKDVEMTHYNIFQYFANADIVKAHLYGQTGGWQDGAYAMLGILMFLAMLVPLALMIKNIIIFVRKKDASVYNADALIYFATMLFFISMVNMFGAWLSAGQVICLIISALILAFTLLTMLITKSVKQLPFFSIVNILLAFIALFLLTWKTYTTEKDAWAPAAAAHVATGGGFMFFMLFVSVAALVTLVVMQMKRFPGVIGHIIEIVVPLAAAVCALIAVISAGAAKPDQVSISGGFVFGMILTVLIAAADTLFTFLKPLQKFKVMVDDSNDGNGNTVYADEKPVEAAADTPANVEQQTAEATEENKTEAPDKIYCPECGEQNNGDSLFCIKCGSKLSK